MKTLKIISAFIISSLIGINGTAQDKIGVFIHGFQGSPEKWTEVSGVPQEWTTGETSILDDFVALGYETEELLTEQAREKLLGDFISEMLDGGKRSLNDNWIIISHSLGGLVARDLYPALKATGFNIVAVVSIGGPSQGTLATNPNQTFIDERLTTMRNKIKAALDKEISTVGSAVKYLDWFKGTNISATIDSIPSFLVTARDSALGYTNEIVEHNVHTQIGPEGEVIKRINGYPKNNITLHPPNYLSVIGAEKNKTPIRIAGQIFDGDPLLKDEVEMTKQFSNLRTKYFQLHEDLYHISFNYHYGKNLTCRAGLRWFDLWNKCQPHEDNFKRERRYRELWKTAKQELDQIDNIWSKIINSNNLVKHTITEYIPECDAGGEEGPLPGFEGFLDIEQLPYGRVCSSNPGGEFIQTDYFYPVPDKNDGVVTTKSVLWDKNHTFNDDYNQYNSDVPHDGGYNHFELRNLERAYDLKDNGSAKGFSEGDLNPAMEDVRIWLKALFQRLGI
ncbi:MAG: hypothetical protein ABJR05_12090 [Balneola sp.]